VNAKDRPVKGPDGTYGTVDTTCWPSLDEKTQTDVDVELKDGSHVIVPADSLIEQRDGSYYLPLKQDQIDAIPHQPEPDPQADGTWPCGDEKEGLRTKD
jgi:hypothetical protein